MTLVGWRWVQWLYTTFMYDQILEEANAQHLFWFCCFPGRTFCFFQKPSVGSRWHHVGWCWLWNQSVGLAAAALPPGPTRRNVADLLSDKLETHRAPSQNQVYTNEQNKLWAQTNTIRSEVTRPRSTSGKHNLCSGLKADGSFIIHHDQFLNVLSSTTDTETDSRGKKAFLSNWNLNNGPVDLILPVILHFPLTTVT